ncbi:MAG: cobalamin biosynthesis protein CbiA [Proteobacteria bacterium]|nr:cobalamin biosynthesis protein CbiA [Pseudomonadota bacterium]
MKTTKRKVNVGILLKGIVIIVGNYGSGKTEVAINLALFMKEKGLDVTVADLDIVNLYFRTREAGTLLSENQIRMILPEKEYLNADFPALNPKIAGLIRTPTELTIIDCGGHEKGANILGTFYDLLKSKPVHMLQVVNPLQPDTGTEDMCMAMKDRIENASRLKVTGLIGNANLIDETDQETVEKGYVFIQTLSKKARLPVEFITIPETLMDRPHMKTFSCPVLPVNRRLLPPWKAQL